MTQPYILQVQAVTPDGTTLVCKHRHDFQGYTDSLTKEYYAIDGGGYYYRCSQNETPAEITLITTDSPHEEQRKVQFWKSYGKDGSLYPTGVYLSLEQMETEHIEAVLATQSHIKGTPVRQLFINELAYRGMQYEG